MKHVWSVAIGVVFLAASSNVLFGQQIPVATGFGETDIGGQRVFVHVTVAVPPGLDAGRLVDEAIRGQGARPIQSQAFALIGLDWTSSSPAGAPSMTQNYNLADSAAIALLNSHGTWNDVVTSTFSFNDGGFTDRCPSLVRDCPGPQYADGLNDIAFVSIGGCCTLAATYYLTDSPEADIGLNSRVNWNSGSFDLETVILHENGHALGLGHTGVSDAVMYATYSVQRRELHWDDEAGETYRYPADGSLGTVSGHVTDADSGNGISGGQVVISNFPGPSDTTDGDGSYSISDVPIVAGALYTITASASDYQSQSKEFAPAVNAVVNFSLSASGGGGDGGGGGNPGGNCPPAGPNACN